MLVISTEVTAGGRWVVGLVGDVYLILWVVVHRMARISILLLLLGLRNLLVVAEMFKK